MSIRKKPRSTCGASYNNKGLLDGDKPKLVSQEYAKASESVDKKIQENMEKSTNDAGETTSSTIQDTLEERGKRYGSFATHSKLSRHLQTSVVTHIVQHGNPKEFTDVMTEAMTMICHKIARIANGDPAYDDNWRDIAGYAQLVVDNLNEKDPNEKTA